MYKKDTKSLEIKEKKYILIKEISLNLFAQQGYAHTSVAEIASKAGISKGLIYNYFKSKQSILESLISDFVRLSYDNFDTNKDGVISTEEFFKFLENSFYIIQQKPQHWKLFTIIGLQKEVMDIMTKYSDDFTKDVEKLLFNFFTEHFAQDAYKELVMFSILIKGAILNYIVSFDNNFLEIAKKQIIDLYKNKLKI